MLIFSELSSKAPFFGVIFGLILFFGLNEIGSIILKNSLINKVVSQVSEIKYQKVFL